MGKYFHLLASYGRWFCGYSCSRSNHSPHTPFFVLACLLHLYKNHHTHKQPPPPQTPSKVILEPWDFQRFCDACKMFSCKEIWQTLLGFLLSSWKLKLHKMAICEGQAQWICLAKIFLNMKVDCKQWFHNPCCAIFSKSLQRRNNADAQRHFDAS